MPRLYKERLQCRICKKRFEVEQNSPVYSSRYASRNYCKVCYAKYNPDAPSEEDTPD